MFKKTGFQSSIVALTLAVMTNGTWAGDPKSCQKVTFSDTGWAELAVTNTMASVVLEGLGYKPKSQFLSLPVTFVSLKNKDVDVFLGNWMPTQKGDIKKYLDDGSIEVLQANLKVPDLPSQFRSLSRTRDSETSPTLPNFATNSVTKSTESNRVTVPIASCKK